MDFHQLMPIYLSGEETYESGEIIIEEGSTGSWVYVVLEGRVKVGKRTDGRTVTIDTLKKGAVFGEMALLGKFREERSASVIIADGPVKLGVLNFELLRKDYEAVSPRLRLLIDTLVMRLNESKEKIAALVVAAKMKNHGAVSTK